jgi:molecular chaperone IbpA
MTTTLKLADALHRSVGLDGLLFDVFGGKNSSSSFPKYDIIKQEDGSAQIQFALAGYSKDDVDVSVKGNILTISSKGLDKDSSVCYNYRGIAKRAFTINFGISKNHEVKSASMEHGMLTVFVDSIVPEADLVKKISVN